MSAAANQAVLALRGIHKTYRMGAHVIAALQALI